MFAPPFFPLSPPICTLHYAKKSPQFFPLQFWQLCHFWPLFLSLWQQESACLVVWWCSWCFESQPGFARAGTSLQLLPLLEPLVGHSSSVLLIWCHPWLMETHKTALGETGRSVFCPPIYEAERKSCNSYIILMGNQGVPPIVSQKRVGLLIKAR